MSTYPQALDMIASIRRQCGVPEPADQALLVIRAMESQLVSLTSIAAKSQIGLGPALELITMGLEEARRMAEIAERQAELRKVAAFDPDEEMED